MELKWFFLLSMQQGDKFILIVSNSFKVYYSLRTYVKVDVKMEG